MLPHRCVSHSAAAQHQAVCNFLDVQRPLRVISPTYSTTAVRHLASDALQPPRVAQQRRRAPTVARRHQRVISGLSTRHHRRASLIASFPVCSTLSVDAQHHRRASSLCGRRDASPRVGITSSTVYDVYTLFVLIARRCTTARRHLLPVADVSAQPSSARNTFCAVAAVQPPSTAPRSHSATRLAVRQRASRATAARRTSFPVITSSFPTTVVAFIRF